MLSLTPFYGNYSGNVDYMSAILNHEPKLLHLILNREITTVAEYNRKNRDYSTERRKKIS
jgi:hypothetical protein